MRKHRTVKFTLRLTEEESSELEVKALARRQDKADYVRRRLFGAGDTPPVPEINYQVYEALTQLRQELCRWGNNLNQLTRQVNSNLTPHLQSLTEIEDHIKLMAGDIKTMQRKSLGLDRDR